MGLTVVLLSGGLDSSVALFWAARTQPGALLAISVNYGQAHRRELDAAARVAALAGVRHRVVRLAFPWAPMAGPVLPGRNTVLLTIAATHGATASGGEPVSVVIGACAADAAGFPDCRPPFLAAASAALTAGLGVPITVMAPFVDRSKADIVRAARELAAWDAVAASWSCYEGGSLPCGACGACRYRSEGFVQAGEVDPWHA